MIDKIKSLNEIGIALSSEGNNDVLLEKILLGAKGLTKAEGGTLYLVTPHKTLNFAIIRNSALGIHQGGCSSHPVLQPDIPLYNKVGEPNFHNVAAAAALKEQTINLANAYDIQGFDFSGTRAFDKRNGYRSESFLTIPLKDHEGKVIGVLQLINAIDNHGKPKAFDKQDQDLVESLASQAAVSLTKQRLMEQLNGMLTGFITAIGQAIDEKSPHTGEHCRRVPILTMMIAEAMEAFTSDQLKELHMAALVHDCGKITTPVHLVDKATRLQTLFDRIEFVQAKLEILRRDVVISVLKGEIANAEGKQRLQYLDEAEVFLRQCNQPQEMVDETKAQKIFKLASLTWTSAHGIKQPLLTEEEVENLAIPKGTLTEGEKHVIQDHVVATIKILQKLTYPEHLKNVPSIAGAHHERMDGKGYPNGLHAQQMSLQARILAFADIFEALTSGDRPYKKAFPLSKSLGILESLCREGHVDPTIYEVFMDKKLYDPYAREFLSPNQYDLKP